jgi:para-nitrobenzyl esterase
MVNAAGRAAFLYQFTHVPPGPRAKEWGAYHASEISYVFGNLRNPSFAYTDIDRTLSDAMSTYWVNFATSGDPNGKTLPTWRPYNVADEPYLEFGDTVQLKQHLLKPQLDALESAQQRRRGSSAGQREREASAAREAR